MHYKQALHPIGGQQPEFTHGHDFVVISTGLSAFVPSVLLGNKDGGCCTAAALSLDMVVLDYISCETVLMIVSQTTVLTVCNPFSVSCIAPWFAACCTHCAVA